MTTGSPNWGHRRLAGPLADSRWLQERLVAEVIFLADEGLERAQLVRVARFAGLDLDVEVTPQVRQVTLKGRDLHRRRQAAHDLVHRQEAAVVAEHRVDRVVGGIGLLYQVMRDALSVTTAAGAVRSRLAPNSSV